MAGINYLFPPDQIHTLPTWRFVLHFVVPPPQDGTALAKAVACLKAAEWKVITFPLGIDSIAYNRATQSVDCVLSPVRQVKIVLSGLTLNDKAT